MDYIEALEQKVRENPGEESRLALAAALISDPGRRSGGRELCFQVIKENSKSMRARILLARLFYLDGMHELSLRELLELKRFGSPPSLERLIDSFGDFGKSYIASRGLHLSRASVETTSAGESVLGEVDIDGDFAELLEQS